MARVQREMAAAADRRAWFVAALCLAWPDSHTETFVGRVHGQAAWPPRGDKGFGYDPMFLPSGETRTFGELDPAEKHAVSHRARAFAQFMAACLGKRGI
jgi:XTP/dITP diphosphohydrolase